MTAALTAYCDGPDCENRQGPHPESMPFRGWIQVVSREPTEPQTHDFCGWDCLTHFAAAVPLPEIVAVQP